MKLNNFIGLFLFFLTVNLNAQEIKLKDNIVFADGTQAFSFDKKALGNELDVYKLNTKEELFRLTAETKGTETPVDDYKKLVFASQNIIIKSSVLRSRNWKFIIELLFTEKVIDLQGTIDVKNLQRFQQKYDEKL